ncbi:hypothetical protein B0H16DRAFT_1888581 [Mycena metata]|uniref:Uncharacterized protein n=1 Tax=Mycena metata TaxID=1033252 RepID=A0AAD7N720_9AGAR|nr:hypothetical protein B0H16DRAFT_1888581 [Mycena metata]
MASNDSSPEVSPVKKVPRKDNTVDAPSQLHPHRTTQERQSPAVGHRKTNVGPKPPSQLQVSADDPFLAPVGQADGPSQLAYADVSAPNNRYGAIREERNRDRSISPLASRRVSPSGSLQALDTGRDATDLESLEEGEIEEHQVHPDGDQEIPDALPDGEDSDLELPDADETDADAEYPGQDREDDVIVVMQAQQDADIAMPDAAADAIGQPAGQAAPFVFGQQAIFAFGQQAQHAGPPPYAAAAAHPPFQLQPPLAQQQPFQPAAAQQQQQQPQHAAHAQQQQPLQPAPAQQQQQQPFQPAPAQQQQQPQHAAHAQQQQQQPLQPAAAAQQQQQPAAQPLPTAAQIALTALRHVQYANPAPHHYVPIGSGERLRDETPTGRERSPHHNVPAEPAMHLASATHPDAIPRQRSEGQIPEQVVSLHKLTRHANQGIYVKIEKAPHNYLLLVIHNGGRTLFEKIPDMVDIAQKSCLTFGITEDEIEVFSLGHDGTKFGGNGVADTYAGSIALGARIKDEAAAQLLLSVKNIVCNEEYSATVRRADAEMVPWVVAMHKPNREPKTVAAQDEACREVCGALAEAIAMSPARRLAIDHAFPANNMWPSIERVDGVIQTIDPHWDDRMKCVVTYMEPCTTVPRIWEQVVDALCGIELVGGLRIYTPLLTPGSASNDPRCVSCKNECHFESGCPLHYSGITWWGAKAQLKAITTGRLGERRGRGGGNAGNGGRVRSGGNNGGGNNNGNRGRGNFGRRGGRGRGG